MIETPSLPPSAELQSDPLPLPGRPFGRVARNVIGYGVLIALMGVTVMVVFVPAALIHCALRNGRRAAWLALTIATALVAMYVAGAPTATPDLEKMAWSLVAALVLAIALPSMVALPLIERGEAFGRVLVFLLVASAVGLAVTEMGALALASFSPYAGLVVQAKQFWAEIMKFYQANGMPAEATRAFEHNMGYALIVMPAWMLIEITVMFVLSLLMIGRLKTWRDHVERRGGTDAPRTYLFRNLSLPDWVLFGFILGGLTPIAHGLVQTVAANVLAVVVFLYMLQGLAIFRFMLVAVGAGLSATLLGWALLVFLSFTGMGPLLLGLAGLFDPFFDFRHFKKRKDDSHESHSD